MSEQTPFKQGDTVACDNCRRARPIDRPVLKLFGSFVGFGPGGETDMFVGRDGEITCHRCLDNPEQYTEANK